MMHWNADGVGGKQLELSKLVCDLLVDVIAISETRLTHNIKLRIPGFSCYRCDKHLNGKGQGVAILVKDDIEHTLVHTPGTNYLESIGVKIKVNNCHYSIYSVYQSPNLPFVTGDIDLLLKTDKSVILMGDFNAKHDHWYPGLRNTNGNLLFNHLLCHDYSIHAPDSPTLVHYRDDLIPSIPDLILANNIHTINDVRVVTALSSNHLPVLFQITGKVDRLSLKRLNYARADWNGYRKLLNESINLSSSILKSPHEIDMAIANLSTSIISARDHSVPLISIKPTTCTIPRKIKRLINVKNKLRRTLTNEVKPDCRKNIRSKINFLGKQINLGLKQHQDSIWNEKLSKVDNPSSDLWRIAKSVRSDTPTSIPPLSRPDGTFTQSRQDQCEELATAFHNNMCLTTAWDSGETDIEVNMSIECLRNMEEGSQFSLVHTGEIRRLIKRLKIRKAPGHDQITNLRIRNLPQKALVLMTKIYNACLALAYFPSIWKLAKVIAIKKPGKNSSIPTSYRPISLLPSLAKLFEKVVCRRLQRVTNDILINQQFGFRHGHSTIQQLARVAENIAQNLNLGISTGMFLLDIEKAFDTVWHNGLIHKLMKYNVPISLVKIIQSYLLNRSFTVHIDKASSEARHIPAGIPQGSILGPYLFLIYLNDIPTQTRTDLACFADDTACFTSSADLDLIIDRLQLAIEKLFEYFNKWKLKLNSSKTEAILFTRKRTQPLRTLKINGHSIAWSKSVKYLGLIMDHKLNWNEHVSYLRLKGMKAFNALSTILNRKSNLSSQTKLLLYTSLIRPCLTYGCPVWSNTSKSNHLKLQVLQNRALKIAFNTPFKTNLTKLQDKIKLPSLLNFIIKMCKKFYLFTNPIHSNVLISNIGKSRPIPNNRYRYTTRLPHHYVLHDVITPTACRRTVET